jgi:hypothetical protein
VYSLAVSPTAVQGDTKSGQIAGGFFGPAFNVGKGSASVSAPSSEFSPSAVSPALLIVGGLAVVVLVVALRRK